MNWITLFLTHGWEKVIKMDATDVDTCDWNLFFKHLSFCFFHQEELEHIFTEDCLQNNEEQTCIFDEVDPRGI